MIKVSDDALNILDSKLDTLQELMLLRARRTKADEAIELAHLLLRDPTSTPSEKHLAKLVLELDEMLALGSNPKIIRVYEHPTEDRSAGDTYEGHTIIQFVGPLCEGVQGKYMHAMVIKNPD